MEKQLQDKLFKKYPKIFGQKDLPINQTCMCWGIECGNGWYKLLDILCSQLQFNTDKNNYPQIEAVQVKEKYGGLRFYYNSIPQENDKWIERHNGTIEGMVSFAEFLSEETCELCGSMDEVSQTKGWIKTLCKNCMKKENNYVES